MTDDEARSIIRQHKADYVELLTRTLLELDYVGVNPDGSIDVPGPLRMRPISRRDLHWIARALLPPDGTVREAA